MQRSRETIISEIQSSWRDSVIASWVVDQLELLHYYSEKSSAVPIHTITITDNLYAFSGTDLISSNKIVISDGLEGTRGYVDAVTYLSEARALMWGEYLRMVLLEPDSYIQKNKNRLPIITQEERSTLWAESDLADAVVWLPSKPEDISKVQHYLNIHTALGSNAWWCTTDEHAHFIEVISRHTGGRLINLSLLVPETPSLHASFWLKPKIWTLMSLILLFQNITEGWLRGLKANSPIIYKSKPFTDIITPAL